VVAALELEADINGVSDPGRAAAWLRSAIGIMDTMDRNGRLSDQVGRYYRDAQVSLGEALLAQRRTAEAKGILDKVTAEEDEIGDKNPSLSARRRIHSHIVLGRLLWRTGRFEQATKQFNLTLGLAERSAKANPTDIAVQFDLSDCYRAFCEAGIAGTFRQRDVTLWRTWNRTQHPYRYSLERESEAAHVAALRW
jgi:tetratricopeptide (TPR) repeat protein